MVRHIFIGSALALAVSGAWAQGQVNVICSVQAEWCNLMSTVYTKTTGTKVNMTAKGSGEALAQLNAEKANPKTDIWFGGTGDPHLQAAEQGLTLEYKSPQLAQLHPWAQKQAADSKYRTVGVYLGPLGFGYNTELLAKRKLKAPQSWADLLKPEFKGEVQMANPASSGTAYTMIATLVQLMGEEKAFEYLKALHPSISTYTRSGTAPVKAAARGETTVSVSPNAASTSSAASARKAPQPMPGWRAPSSPQLCATHSQAQPRAPMAKPLTSSPSKPSPPPNSSTAPCLRPAGMSDAAPATARPISPSHSQGRPNATACIRPLAACSDEKTWPTASKPLVSCCAYQGRAR